MAPRRRRSFVALVGVVAAGGCGGGQTKASPFDPGWVDDHGAAVAEVEAAFRKVRVPLGADVAVGVISKKGLVGVPLDGGPVWTFLHELHGRPAVAGTVVVAAGKGEVFALEARTGKLLWARATGGRVRGAGDDGATTVVSLIPTAGFGSLVLAVRRDGSVARQIEEDELIGVPAIAGDTVFLPWRGRFLSVYDLPTGEERARVVLPGPVSRAFAEDGVIFAGEASFTRFDARISRTASASTASLARPLGGLPGDPAWTRAGTDWVNREAETLDKIRLYARPTAVGPAGVDDGRFAATYYNVALGFDARSGALLWARPHRADFLGGAAYRGGFALCDAGGTVTFLDARSGTVAGHVSLGKAVDACVVQADAFTQPLDAGAPGPPPLAEQVARILELGATELGPLQEVLRREMTLRAVRR
jgi:outer membrane protein assembly factor BamB